MNYFEFYSGDYSRDTAHLSLAEHGAFLLLLSAYYSTEKPLPADHASLCRIARAMTPAEQKAVRNVADEFFPLADDGLRHNARADAEIIKAQKRIGAARDNGKKGGRPPKKEPKENPLGFDRETQSEPSNKAPQTPHAIPPTDRLSEGTRDERAAPTPNPVALLAVVLNRAGLRCTAMNPDLIAYHDAGGTADHLADIARHPDCAGKTATYAIRFARRELTAPAKPIAQGATHATPVRLSAVERVRANVIAAERRDAEAAGLYADPYLVAADG